MERDLYYRVNALLDNIEENFSYVIQHSSEYKLYLDVFSEISNFKNKINIEDESIASARLAARAEVDDSLAALRVFVDGVNIRKNEIYRKVDKETLVVDHINDRFLLISRLIKEARSKLDRAEEGLSLVPREAPAPIRVIIANNKLELVAPKKHIGSVPDPSVDRFRIAARDILKRAITSISGSGNVDPRFLPCCEGLAFELLLLWRICRLKP